VKTPGQKAVITTSYCIKLMGILAVRAYQDPALFSRFFHGEEEACVYKVVWYIFYIS
jgi:hypothetical protein